MTMPPRDLPDKYKDLVRKGWYQGETKGSEFSGVPETEQERAWIIDYMQRTGEVPTLGQANEAMRGVPRSEYRYTPESTMGGLGFKTFDEYLKAQGEGESYGPWTGSLVPEGGRIQRDISGRPIARYMNPERRVTLQPERRGYFPQEDITEESIPQYKRAPFQPPTLEDVGKASPAMLYRARVYDYLEGLKQQDAPQIEELKQLKQDAQMRLTLLKEQIQQRRLDDPNYKKETADREIDRAQLEYSSLFRLIDEKAATLMTPEKAQLDFQAAVQRSQRGYSGPDLPYFAESLNTTGEQVGKLWTEAIWGTKDKYGKLIKEGAWQAYEGQPKPPLTGAASVIAFQQNILEEQRKHPNVRYSLPTEEIPPGPATQQEFQDYVTQLNIAGPSRQWLFDNFQTLLRMWYSSGPMESRGNFASWLNRFLAGENR